MINELYALSAALDKANIRPQSWHRRLLPLPNVTPKAPCVRVLLRQDGTAALSAVSKENAATFFHSPTVTYSPVSASCITHHIPAPEQAE